MRNQYNNLSSNSSIKDIIDWIANANRNRIFDVEDYQNQISSNPFIYNVPASSSDISGTEKVGDLACDASYLYIVVDNSGTLEWRRVGISSF